MTNKELLDKIREEILHLKMKELQRMNGINTGADVYLSSYAVLSILSNALTEESEDERIRKYLIDFVGLSDNPRKGEILAYLEKQKEQKPAEWSEEDADILNCCISSIEEAKENRYAYKETDGDTSYDREIAFLESLRPSWKPSEEQMKALEVAFRKDGDDNYRSTINSLYNDLKKL